MYRNRKLIIISTLVAAGTVHLAASAARPVEANQQPQVKTLKGEEFAKNSKVTINEARTIALKAHPGKITDEELEKEKGGSGLRYSFDIQDSAGTHEVGVDAKTGKVLENKLEGPDAD